MQSMKTNAPDDGILALLWLIRQYDVFFYFSSETSVLEIMEIGNDGPGLYTGAGCRWC